MGNKVDICSDVACQQLKVNQLQIIPRFHNLQEIQKQIVQYSKEHRLMFYTTQQRNILQTLLALRQKHVCDKIVLYTQKRKDQAKKNIMNDLLKVDFQKMDQLFFGSFKIQKEGIDYSQFDSKKTVQYIVSSTALSLKRIQQLSQCSDNIQLDMKKFKPNQQQKHQIEVLKKSKETNDFSKNDKFKLNFQQKLSSPNFEQFVKIGRKSIQKNQIIVLACIQCFNGIGALNKTQLPTKKSPLQILLDKMQAINQKYHYQCSTSDNSMILTKSNNSPISSSSVSKSNSISISKNNFTQIILLINANYLQAATQLCSTNYPSLNSMIHLIKYESIYPSVDFQGKFILKQNQIQSRLDFSHNVGDILDFISKNLYIAQLIQKHKYMHWVDPMNLLDKVCDPFMIGCLKKSKEKSFQKTQIIGKIIQLNKDQQQRDQRSIQLQDGFIQIQDNQKNDIKKNNKIEQKQDKLINKKYQQNYVKVQLKKISSSNQEQKFNVSLIKSFIIDTSLIINRSKFQDRILLTRVKRQLVQDKSLTCKNKYVFKRSFEDILKQSFTKLLFVQKQLQYAHLALEDVQDNSSSLNIIKRKRISQAVYKYSNYCKQFLKIKSQSQSQLVEICPQILFGSKQVQKKIKKTFQDYNKVGFPLVIKKNESKLVHQ